MSKKTITHEGWMQFLALCHQSSSPARLDSLFDLFFTIEEKQQLASRYQIVHALLEGKLTQREIAKKFGVSIAQITRGSNALKVISPEMRRFLQQARWR